MTIVSTMLRPRTGLLARILAVILLFVPGSLTVRADPSASLDRQGPPKAVSVAFWLEPNSATVWRRTGEGQVNFLGRSGETVSIGLTKMEAKRERDILVEFRVPLWFSEWVGPPEHLSLATLESSHRYPTQGTRRLELGKWDRFQAFTRANPLGTLSLFVVLVGLPWLVRSKGRWLTEEKVSAYGEYTLGAKLGEGAMGEVYVATDSVGNRFAIKVLRSLLSESADFRKRFDQEIAVCTKLNHPNLIRFFGYGITPNGQVYMTCELLEGQDLKTLLNLGGLDRRRLAAEVLEDIGAALDYLHQTQVIHHDVKPSNIFVGKDGTLKLLDFGIAKGIQSSNTESSSAGTPAYMAPEQFEGQAVANSDQYSLGLVLFEILAGKRPFPTEDPTALNHLRATETPSPPTDSDAINDAVLKMLAIHPTQRFETLAEARKALTDHLLDL